MSRNNFSGSEKLGRRVHDKTELEDESTHNSHEQHCRKFYFFIRIEIESENLWREFFKQIPVKNKPTSRKGKDFLGIGNWNIGGIVGNLIRLIFRVEIRLQKKNSLFRLFRGELPEWKAEMEVGHVSIDNWASTCAGPYLV